jgi:hypothetical protein
MAMHDTYRSEVPPVIEALIKPQGATQNITTALRAVYIILDWASSATYDPSSVRKQAAIGTSALQSFVEAMYSRFGVPIAAEYLLTDTCVGSQLCKHYYRHDIPANITSELDCFRYNSVSKKHELDVSTLKRGSHRWSLFNSRWNFKNSAAYMFGFARIGAFARYVVHMDADWNVKVVQQNQWASTVIKGRNWIERAANALGRYEGSYLIEVGENNNPPNSLESIEGGGGGGGGSRPTARTCTCEVSLQAFVLDTDIFRTRLLPTSFGHTEGALYDTCELYKEQGDTKVCTIGWGSSVLGIEKVARPKPK